MARGITLEGLVVSYFFRTSNTFDTLMQMGRWFGYRDGYIDACRLYLEKDTAVNFRNVAVATQRMRDDFDDMNYRGIKPKEYSHGRKHYPHTPTHHTPVKQQETSTYIDILLSAYYVVTL